VSAEVEVGDDLRVEQAADVRRERHAVAGPHRLRNRRAAEHVAPFEHDRPQTGARAIRGGDQPVVTTPDDRDVGRQRFLALRFGLNGSPTTYFPRLERSASTSSQPMGVNAPQSCGRAS
jgi:hypothetical protein